MQRVFCSVILAGSLCFVFISCDDNETRSSRTNKTSTVRRLGDYDKGPDKTEVLEHVEHWADRYLGLPTIVKDLRFRAFPLDDPSRVRISVKGTLALEKALYTRVHIGYSGTEDRRFLTKLHKFGLSKNDLWEAGFMTEQPRDILDEFTDTYVIYTKENSKETPIDVSANLEARENVDGWEINGGLEFSGRLPDGETMDNIRQRFGASNRQVALLNGPAIETFLNRVKEQKKKERERILREHRQKRKKIARLEKEKERRIRRLSEVLQKGVVLKGEYSDWEHTLPFELTITKNMQWGRDKRDIIHFSTFGNIKWLEGVPTYSHQLHGPRMYAKKFDWSKKPNARVEGICRYDLADDAVYCKLEIKPWVPDSNSYLASYGLDIYYGRNGFINEEDRTLELEILSDIARASEMGKNAGSTREMLEIFKLMQVYRSQYGDWPDRLGQLESFSGVTASMLDKYIYEKPPPRANESDTVILQERYQQTNLPRADGPKLYMDGHVDGISG